VDERSSIFSTLVEVILLHSGAQAAKWEIARRLAKMNSKVSLAMDVWSTRQPLRMSCLRILWQFQRMS
jgi:hypothetical protein